MSTLPVFPVDSVIPDLVQALRADSLVLLSAPPGSGKTTRVPLAILERGAVRAGRIVMLEPRRVAALTVADFMARSLGERLGQTVGLRIRHHTTVSRSTRVEVVTEGVLTRMLQDDPELPGVDLVIFDEFHERSVHTDLGLALCLDVQRSLRPDLKLLLMSATLDIASIPKQWRNAPHIEASGTLYDVVTRYEPMRIGGDLFVHAARVVAAALRETEGDILVFLPGTKEIRRVQDELERLDIARSAAAVVRPLLGSLELDAQRLALEPDRAGRRKVVLATSVAQTSLTIEGVRVVIDAGLERLSAFDSTRGMERLETRAVSQAAGDQRRGRAGRLGPGQCIRLWSAAQDDSRPRQTEPEILRTDLTYLVLQLAAWGVRDPQAVPFPTEPPDGAFRGAQRLLTDLGALDNQGILTARGREMATLPVHPRLAALLLWARGAGVLGPACWVAAFLDDRTYSYRIDDLAQLITEWREQSRLRALARDAQHYWSLLAGERELSDDLRELDDDLLGRIVLQAYPDRVARLRGEGTRYLLANGVGAVLSRDSRLVGAEWLVALILNASGADARIQLAARLNVAYLEKDFSDSLHTVQAEQWRAESGAVEIKEQRVFGSIVLQERRLEGSGSEQATVRLVREIGRAGLTILSWSDESRSVQERAEWLGAQPWAPPGWPDMLMTRLAATVEEWLLPFVAGASRLSQVSPESVTHALRFLLGEAHCRALERLAPREVTLPSARTAEIRYSKDRPPYVRAKLQEFFGPPCTLSVGDGRLPLTLELLSPAGRPLQITNDLSSFWKSEYANVLKEMRGRYPKHYWPDDPFTAEPMQRTVKRRG